MDDEQRTITIILKLLFLAAFIRMNSRQNFNATHTPRRIWQFKRPHYEFDGKMVLKNKDGKFRGVCTGNEEYSQLFPHTCG